MIVIYRLILCESPEQFQLYPAKTLQSDDLRLSFFSIALPCTSHFSREGKKQIDFMWIRSEDKLARIITRAHAIDLFRISMSVYVSSLVVVGKLTSSLNNISLYVFVSRTQAHVSAFSACYCFSFTIILVSVVFRKCIP